MLFLIILNVLICAISLALYLNLKKHKKTYNAIYFISGISAVLLCMFCMAFSLSDVISVKTAREEINKITETNSNIEENEISSAQEELAWFITTKQIIYFPFDNIYLDNKIPGWQEAYSFE